MEQLYIPRPFGTEGATLHIRFIDNRWVVELAEWTGDTWFTLDRETTRSSDAALARGLYMLATYRDALAGPLDAPF